MLSRETAAAVTSNVVAAMMEEQMRSSTGFGSTPPAISGAGEIPAVPDPDFRGNPVFVPIGGQFARPTTGQMQPPPSVPAPPPFIADGSANLTYNLEIWRLLPHVKDLPQEMVRQLPLSALFQLNAALAKESKVAEKLSVNSRLAQNAAKLTASPAAVQAGWDDRKELLHDARFLGGASCSGQYLWLKAREVLGPKGVVPIGNYDMDVVGCGGCVTPRGWQELQNPASPDLKLKLFYMPNVSSSNLSAKRLNIEDGESGLCIGDSMKEIADFEGFRAALHTLREAMACAMPWNRSVAAIQGFMINTNYCNADLKDTPKKAAVLAEFVDFVLSRNALNWENKVPFLSADELQHVWSSWKGKRAAFFVSANGGSVKEKKKQDNKRVRDDICRRYNRGDCPYKPEDCKTYYGFKLRHVCCYVLPGGKKCEQSHPKVEHK
jgi:hypothetical protein